MTSKHPPFITAPALSADGIVHGFFGRQGGTSRGTYGTLNCGLGSHDERVHVHENRRRIVTALLGQDAPLITPYQVHSPDCAIVHEPWSEEPQRVDAVATNTPGIVIAIGTADCGPVLFSDHKNGVVAAAHAGWKGAVGGVLENTLRRMEELGAARDSIHAVLGPTISQPSYEVGTEFRKQILDLHPGQDHFFVEGKDKEHYQFDLPGFIVMTLKAEQVSSASWTGHCTYRLEREYFSYRRTVHQHEPDYGRQLAAIALK